MTIAPIKTLHTTPCPPAYYLSRTAAGGGMQPNARWWNLGELFSLPNGAEADPEAVMNLARGRSPHGYGVLIDTIPHRAIDITFRADPSVAALWASLDADRRTLVEQCQFEAAAYALQAVEWNECAYQVPHYSRFLPTPADILGVLFQHTHTAELGDIDIDPPGELHVHCFVFGIARSRVAKSWGPLHRPPFTTALDYGARIYQQLFMRALRRRLDIDSEPYHYDDCGPHYRVIGHPAQWHRYCGDRAATNPALRPPMFRPS